jgi:hypothetical protein
MGWFLVIVCLLVIYFLVSHMVGNRRRESAKLTIITGGGNNESAGRQLLDNARDGSDRILAGRALMNTEAGADLITRAYTEALENMTLEEAPFIIDEAELLEQEMLWATLTPQFNVALAVARPLRSQSVAQRAEVARESAHTRQEAVDKFHESMVQHHSDPQNTHDSSVGRDLRDTLQRIDSTYTGRVDTLRELTGVIETHPRRSHAARTVSTIMKSNANLITYGMTEMQILDRVWERSYASGNEGACADMQNAVVTALADCVENDVVTCANGRAARILGSLALLDYDPAVGTAQTTEAYKNEIYGEVRRSLDSALTDLRSDGRLRSIVDSYSGIGDPDPAESTEWALLMENRIDDILNAYRSRIPPVQLASIKTDCMHYASL